MQIENDYIPKDGLDVPGPCDWEQGSHGLEYDHVNHTVQTWVMMGPMINGERKFRLMTRIRHMTLSEVICSVNRSFSREDVLATYGYDETEIKRLDNLHREFTKQARGFEAQAKRFRVLTTVLGLFLLFQIFLVCFTWPN